MEKYNVKRKGPDGKYLTFGNVSEGKFGPQLGMRATPDLKRLVTETAEGQWINFSLFLDNRDKQPKAQSQHPVQPLNDEVPF